MLELFPWSAWVILKTLSYFAFKILELLSDGWKKAWCRVAHPDESCIADSYLLQGIVIRALIKKDRHSFQRNSWTDSYNHSHLWKSATLILPTICEWQTHTKVVSYIHALVDRPSRRASHKIWNLWTPPLVPIDVTEMELKGCLWKRNCCRRRKLWVMLYPYNIKVQHHFLVDVVTIWKMLLQYCICHSIGQN